MVKRLSIESVFMKKFVIILFYCTLISCKSTFKVIEKPTDYSIVVKKGRVEGVVFLQNADCFAFLQDKEKFNLSTNDINKAEGILKQKLASINFQRMNQVGSCPIIHKNLKSYRRQYFGYIDENENKIMYVTFYWNRYTIFDRIQGYHHDESESWKQELDMVCDGCSHYWDIQINLDKETLFDLNVNGL